MSPRRTDTRQRAIEVALELFTEHGYDNTSLREIAERLGIKKASLYYHFASKEALLAGIMESLLAPVDELVAWGQSQPRSAETRQEILRRIAALLQGPWSRWIRFMQENQPAMRHHRAEGDRTQPRMLALFTAVVDLHADARQQGALAAGPGCATSRQRRADGGCPPRSRHRDDRRADASGGDGHRHGPRGRGVADSRRTGLPENAMRGGRAQGAHARRLSSRSTGPGERSRTNVGGTVSWRAVEAPRPHVI